VQNGRSAFLCNSFVALHFTSFYFIFYLPLSVILLSWIYM